MMMTLARIYGKTIIVATAREMAPSRNAYGERAKADGGTGYPNPILGAWNTHTPRPFLLSFVIISTNPPLETDESAVSQGDQRIYPLVHARNTVVADWISAPAPRLLSSRCFSTTPFLHRFQRGKRDSDQEDPTNAEKHIYIERCVRA